MSEVEASILYLIAYTHNNTTLSKNKWMLGYSLIYLIPSVILGITRLAFSLNPIVISKRQNFDLTAKTLERYSKIKMLNVQFVSHFL